MTDVNLFDTIRIILCVTQKSRRFRKKMEKLFSISKTAKIVNMTTETLRYYDRIGLAHPSQIDKWSKYRYYSEKDIVRLNTIRALSCMEIPLKEIKKLIELNNIEEIVKFLQEALIRADEKISELYEAKQRILRAKNFYESKIEEKPQNNIFVRDIPKRMVLLSDKLSQPTIENLWNYHRHYYAQVGEAKKEEFDFEDLAGIYESDKTKNLFAVCKKYSQTENLIELPKGKYLCAECTEDNYHDVLQTLIDAAKIEYSTEPKFIVRLIVLTGILQWRYEIQILIQEDLK